MKSPFLVIKFILLFVSENMIVFSLEKMKSSFLTSLKVLEKRLKGNLWQAFETYCVN